MELGIEALGNAMHPKEGDDGDEDDEDLLRDIANHACWRRQCKMKTRTCITHGT